MYLSSWRVGDHPERLLGLLERPAGARTAVIANAVDALADGERRVAVEREMEALSALGLRPVEVDLRTFFGQDPRRVADVLRGFPLLWARGGNVFVLRHALGRSGADRAIVELLREDAIVYAGYSAGACVLAPELNGLERCDDPHAVHTAYGAQARFDGLAVLDHVVVPHVGSPGHPESEILDAVAERYRVRGVAHRTMRDGQAIVINSPAVDVR
ncbi:Type 1 glutamine amidotransferase-like domain-containing protein [Spirillospora sp. NPDC047279]|uniref:Type 1 glutamine amidotransferase-like domain-containing protein n=1 Tax=Spirillospora sp. NPDC047279 TaxID=3155478 RepID=UPI00340E2D26